MNIMNVTKKLVCINFCFRNNWWCFEVETWLLRHSMLYLYYGMFKFQSGQNFWN